MRTGEPLRLITIGPSHYCEKARWALDRLGIPYREERHPPVFQALVAKRIGGRRTVPVLVTPERTLSDSTDILQYLDTQAPPELRLYPEDAAARREAEELEELFDETLGPHARRLAYYHLLDDPNAVPALTDGVRRLERGLFRLSLPLCKGLMRRLMRIDAAGAERSRQKIDGVFAKVAELLADGRPYLTGERFTAADLTFAALAAIVLAPPEYGFPLPPLSESPPAYQSDVAHYRDLPGGEYALKLYRTLRQQELATTP